MTRYHLAKIVDWAGSLQSRKRMQKVAYLLQIKGLPLDASFGLHHYGPYSHEVARLSDEMVQSSLLAERTEPIMVGQQYSYRLTDEAKKQLADFESVPRGSELARRMAEFKPLAEELLRADLKELEVASTIVFFRKQGHDWPAAVEKTREFKELPAGTQFLKRAEELSRRIVD
jgi:uncharacterized protein